MQGAMGNIDFFLKKMLPSSFLWFPGEIGGNLTKIEVNEKSTTESEFQVLLEFVGRREGMKLLI